MPTSQSWGRFGTAVRPPETARRTGQRLAGGGTRPPFPYDGPRHARILFLAPQPFYEDRGTPIAVHLALEALSELGYAVDLVTFPIGEAVDIPGLEIHRVANPFGVRSVPIGFSFRKLLLDGGLAREAVRRLAAGDYSCVHAVEEAAFPIVGPARRQGVPVLYDMQSNLPEGMEKYLPLRLPPFRQILHGAQRWLLRQVDSVVCSAGLEPYVEAAAPGTPVAAWQYPAMPIQAHPDAVERVRAELNVRGRPVVLYTGNLEGYQGVGRLVEAMPRVLESVPDALFVLVGADDKGVSRLPAIAGELMGCGSLRAIDRQPRERIPAYLAAADVVVSPREDVGNLPLKVFDYMAAGKPIVATDTSSHRSALSERNAELVRSDPAAMARGIVALLRDPERAAILGRHAHEYAAAHLGWDDYRDRLDGVYSALIGGRVARF